jgi:hypothetical protein
MPSRRDGEAAIDHEAWAELQKTSPVTHPYRAGTPPVAMPGGFRVLCSACGEARDAATEFERRQLKKKHPRCRACAPNKYSNRKDQGGASRKESKRARYLAALAAAGLIHDLEQQVRFELIPAQRSPSGKLLEPTLSYVADFVYLDQDGVLHVEDAKGMRTDVYKLKRKLMLYLRKIQIEEV